MPYRAVGMEHTALPTVCTTVRRVRSMAPMMDKLISLECWDTASRSLGHMNMRGSRVFLVFFSVTDRSSFESVVNVYERALREHFGVSVSPEDSGVARPLLVACKVDCSPQFRRVGTAEASHLADRLGWDYVEASAWEGLGVERALMTAVHRALLRRPRCELPWEGERLLWLAIRRPSPECLLSKLNQRLLVLILLHVRSCDCCGSLHLPYPRGPSTSQDKPVSTVLSVQAARVRATLRERSMRSVSVES
mmetsp:Transcript_16067/g.37876  ORF Transcript_16067/g.37876 Transcript_16067/m.37876 type:complete len:250 (+) Transcript_16067:262-1011(+)